MAIQQTQSPFEVHEPFWIQGDYGSMHEWRDALVLEAVTRYAAPEMLGIVKELVQLKPRLARDLHEKIDMVLWRTVDVAFAICETLRTEPAVPETMDRAEALFAGVVRKTFGIDSAGERELRRRLLTPHLTAIASAESREAWEPIDAILEADHAKRRQ